MTNLEKFGLGLVLFLGGFAVWGAYTVSYLPKHQALDRNYPTTITETTGFVTSDGCIYKTAEKAVEAQDFIDIRAAVNDMMGELNPFISDDFSRRWHFARFLVDYPEEVIEAYVGSRGAAFVRAVVDKAEKRRRRHEPT